MAPAAPTTPRPVPQSVAPRPAAGAPGPAKLPKSAPAGKLGMGSLYLLALRPPPYDRPPTPSVARPDTLLLEPRPNRVV